MLHGKKKGLVVDHFSDSFCSRHDGLVCRFVSAVHSRVDCMFFPYRSSRFFVRVFLMVVGAVFSLLVGIYYLDGLCFSFFVF